MVFMSARKNYMKINNEKLVSYILIITGLCIMIYSIATAIIVFTGNGNIPVKILEEKTTQQGSSSDIMAPLFPMFNALIWLGIAFFLIAAGGRIVRVGIQMMKASLPDIKIVKEIKEMSHDIIKKREREDFEKTK